MAEPRPQDSFAEKEESDNYSDDLGIEDLLDTESGDRVCVLLVAAGVTGYFDARIFCRDSEIS